MESINLNKSNQSSESTLESTQITDEICESIITKEQYTQFESLGESMNLLDLGEDFNG